MFFNRTVCNIITRLDTMSLNKLEQINKLEEKIEYAVIQVKSLLSTLNDLREELNVFKSDNNSNSHLMSVKRELEIEDWAIEKKPKYSFMKDNNHVVVYTDGACSKNGKSGAKAGIGVWWGPNHPLNVAAQTRFRHTNNAAEIQACTAACKIANKNGINKLLIKTDSQFVINCMTVWINKWKQNNWKTQSGHDVINKSDLVELETEMQSLEDVKYEHVKGHAGNKGNVEADKLAVLGAKKTN